MLVFESSSELLYFADPMCSWCWGFLPSVKKLVERYGDQTMLSVVLGGLHCGTQKSLEPSMKETIRCHWERVHEATGQPFDRSFFDRPDFVYDTEPSCRAVVAARRIAVECALPVLERLHRAFYAENRDITDEPTLVSLCAEHLGISETRFAEVYGQEETQLETYSDFELARELGVRGFPTLLAREACSITVLTQGYSPLEKLEPALAEWFEVRAREVAS